MGTSRVWHLPVWKPRLGWGPLWPQGEGTEASWAVLLLSTATISQNKNTPTSSEKKLILCRISKHRVNISIEQINLIETPLSKSAVKAFWRKISSDRNIVLRLSSELLGNVFPQPREQDFAFQGFVLSLRVGSAYVSSMAHHPPETHSLPSPVDKCKRQKS